MHVPWPISDKLVPQAAELHAAAAHTQRQQSFGKNRNLSCDFQRTLVANRC